MLLRKHYDIILLLFVFEICSLNSFSQKSNLKSYSRTSLNKIMGDSIVYRFRNDTIVNIIAYQQDTHNYSNLNYELISFTNNNNYLWYIFLDFEEISSLNSNKSNHSQYNLYKFYNLSENAFFYEYEGKIDSVYLYQKNKIPFKLSVYYSDGKIGCRTMKKEKNRQLIITDYLEYCEKGFPQCKEKKQLGKYAVKRL